MTDPKPVLWVGMTGFAGEYDRSAMDAIGDDIREMVGDEYHVVVADDRVRLMPRDELLELLGIDPALVADADEDGGDDGE